LKVENLLDANPAVSPLPACEKCSFADWTGKDTTHGRHTSGSLSVERFLQRKKTLLLSLYTSAAFPGVRAMEQENFPELEKCGQ